MILNNIKLWDVWIEHQTKNVEKQNKKHLIQYVFIIANNTESWNLHTCIS